jgi:hypothetical protein
MKTTNRTAAVVAQWMVGRGDRIRDEQEAAFMFDLTS